MTFRYAVGQVEAEAKQLVLRQAAVKPFNAAPSRTAYDLHQERPRLLALVAVWGEEENGRAAARCYPHTDSRH